MRLTTTLVRIAGFVAIAAAVLLQAQSTQKPTFEAASIKRNTSRPATPEAVMLGCNGTDSRSPIIEVPKGRCVAKYQPLRMVVALAFDVPPAFMYPYEGKVIAGPEWINSEIYDIEAKAESPTTQAELKVMLQELLAERFSLKVHRENREMPVYALVLGKNGLKLREAPERECAGQVRRDHRYELGASTLKDQCHAFIPEDGALKGQSVDMSDFAEMLSIWAERIVIDKTGIKGLYDIKMPRLAAASVVAQISEKAAVIGGRGGGADVRMPELPQTVFTALDPLGLKLEATKGPVEVIVIDNIARPSEN